MDSLLQSFILQLCADNWISCDDVWSLGRPLTCLYVPLSRHLCFVPGRGVPIDLFHSAMRLDVLSVSVVCAQAPLPLLELLEKQGSPHLEEVVRILDEFDAPDASSV